jgi:hypothetical protein
MADQSCEKELNNQLQAIQGRLKSLEKNMASVQQSLMQSFISLIAGLTANELYGAVAILMANPIVLQLVTSAIGDCWEEISKLIPLLDYEEMYAKLLLKLLTEMPYPGSLIDNVNAAIMSQINDALANYEWLLNNGGTPEALEEARQLLVALQNMLDSVGNIFSKQNKLALCKTASQVLTVV